MDDIELLKKRVEELERQLANFLKDGQAQLSKLHIDKDLALGGLTIKTEGYTSKQDYDLLTVFTANEEKASNYAAFVKNRGTIKNPQPCQEGDEIFSLFFAGRDSLNEPAWVAEITVGTEGKIKAGPISGNFQFKLPNENGVIDSSLTIHSDRLVEFHKDALTTNCQSSELFLKIKVGEYLYALPLFKVLT